MASAGLLLLLLVSSSLLSSLSASNQPAKSRKEKVKEGFQIGARFLGTGLEYITPYLELIPVAGQYIKLVSETLQKILSLISGAPTDPTLGLYKDEFEKLNKKIDNVETKWDALEKDYNKNGNSISHAWTEYENLEKVCSDPKKSSEDKQHQITNFKGLHNQVIKYTHRLNDLLKYTDPTSAGGTGVTKLNKFGKILVDHVRCHEKEIKVFSLLTYLLINQGIAISNFNDRVDKVNKANTLAKIAFDSSFATFQIQKYCLSNFMNYIEEDIKELVAKYKKEKKEDIANKIRLFLDKTHENYDWMVVVYLNKGPANQKIPRRKTHTIDGFDNTEIDNLMVSVAKQLKGTHTKARKVSSDIESCLKNKKVKCSDIPKVLKECKSVDGQKISETYSAVHAFIKESHHSMNAKNAKDAPINPKGPAAKTPYYYEGECLRTAKTKRTFVVLIKSDEEIEKKDPCKNKNCGGEKNGKCTVLENTEIAVCECKESYYGDECEKDLKEFEKSISSAKMPC